MSMDRIVRRESATRSAQLADRWPYVPRSGPAGDVDLIKRCRHGEAAAWDALVAKYERLVFSVALRNGLGREDAADLTQTVFLALLDSMEAIRDGDRLAFWLMTVTRRHAWRLRSRRDREEPVPEATLDRPDAADVYGDWERTVALQEALHQVDDPCRELLIRLYFDPAEPSYADIGRSLGLAVGTIGPMRGRCLRRLRELLGEGAR